MDFPENILAILPAPSRAKLESLRIERDAARAAYVAASDAWQAARQEHGLLEARVQQQLSQFQGYEVLAPGEAFRRGAAEAAKSEAEERLMGPVVASKRRLDLAAAAMERAAERQASFGYLENIRQWLSRAAAFGGMRLEHHAPAAPKVRDPLAEIQKLRAELAGLDAAWTAAENAPAPAAELRSRFLAELDAIAAAVIGGTSMFGGKGSVIGAALGAIVLTLISNGLDLLAVNQFYRLIITGAIIIIAVGLDRLTAQKAS